ncbi:MAG: GNAT family N-acetyltransferase [Oscillospiraceae bacterium]|jgi:GNAT superfamily N-acetyltransferase|nr:GNAT family N-acetyltransferase [Oscillospiraceae bacterium]
MIQLTDMETLTALLKKFPRAKSNFYILPADHRRLVASGTLFYDEAPGGVLFYERRGEVYKLFFRAADFSRCELPPCTEPLSSYLPFRAAPDAEAEAWLFSQGFVYRHTELKLTAESISAPRRHEITPATGEEADEFFRLTFPNRKADLPERAFYETLQAVRDESGKPLGMVHYGGTREVLLISVLPQARGQGIALSLFSAYADGVAHLEGPHRILVVDGNTPAQTLYAKLGYLADGLKINFYYKDPDTGK